MYGFYDPSKDFHHMKSLLDEEYSLLSDNINDIFFDSNGTSWFATNKGVSKLKSSNDVFKLNSLLITPIVYPLQETIHCGSLMIMVSPLLIIKVKNLNIFLTLLM